MRNWLIALCLLTCLATAQISQYLPLQYYHVGIVPYLASLVPGLVLGSPTQPFACVYADSIAGASTGVPQILPFATVVPADTLKDLRAEALVDSLPCGAGATMAFIVTPEASAWITHLQLWARNNEAEATALVHWAIYCTPYSPDSTVVYSPSWMEALTDTLPITGTEWHLYTWELTRPIFIFGYPDRLYSFDGRCSDDESIYVGLTNHSLDEPIVYSLDHNYAPVLLDPQVMLYAEESVRRDSITVAYRDGTYWADGFYAEGIAAQHAEIGTLTVRNLASEFEGALQLNGNLQLSGGLAADGYDGIDSTIVIEDIQALIVHSGIITGVVAP